MTGRLCQAEANRGDADAATTCDRALEISQAVYGNDNPHLVKALDRVANLKLASNDAEAAVRLLQRAVALTTSSNFDVGDAINSKALLAIARSQAGDHRGGAALAATLLPSIPVTDNFVQLRGNLLKEFPELSK